MYAARKYWVKNSTFTPPDDRYAIAVTRGGKPISEPQPDKISVIEEEVMYWRKANHIHQWFVDNVQNGEDDCKEYHVDMEALQELLEVCDEVIKGSKLIEGTVVVCRQWDQKTGTWIDQTENGKVIEDTTVAERLLPRSEGFFFGSNGYDEGYLQDVIDTRAWLTTMLEDEQRGVDGDVYYSSSW